MTAPMTTTSPTVSQYLAGWLADVVEPNLEPATYAYYETMTRLYIVPALGAKRLDRLQVDDVQAWLGRLAMVCQCCAQGKDAARPAGQQRCCATGACCGDFPSRRTLLAARNTLRAALYQAKTSDGLVTKNVAAMVTVRNQSKRQRRGGSAWSIEEAAQFLQSARDDDDPLYAAYVLVLVNGLRKGEVLGLTWSAVDLDGGELETGWQLQRVRRELIHGRRGTAEGTGTLPMPDICVAALQVRRDEQAATREQAGSRWHHRDLVFTTRWGTPVEPRNFNRSFDARCTKAGVPRIRVHDARRTCAALLNALDMHPQVTTRILRHAQVAMTLKSCADGPEDVTRTALKKLGEALGGLPPVQRDVS
jgi:integrase